MSPHHWFLLAGFLLILMVGFKTYSRHWPVTTAMLYLGVGWLLARMDFVSLSPFRQAELIEHLTELAVILSLFGAGLKMRLPFSARKWRLPIALAFLSMSATVGMMALLGHLLMGLPWGAAVLLGAILAPTDPVLASDVQVDDARDTERLRFTLTGEAGFNDGTAFPFVMLGLGLLNLHELGTGGWRWWGVDVLWAVTAGLASGAILGMAIGRFVIYLRKHHREAIGLDDFLAAGLIALSYGFGVAIHAYGFLSVFAAGLALRAVERRLSGTAAPPDVKALAGTEEELAGDERHAPAYMAEAVLHFNEQLERAAELTLVMLVGFLLEGIRPSWNVLAVSVLLLILVRPLSVFPVARGMATTRMQGGLLSWFGIRGIGSLYYLFYAISHGLPRQWAEPLLACVIGTIALSIALHGVTVTPLMRMYKNRTTPPLDDAA